MNNFTWSFWEHRMWTIPDKPNRIRIKTLKMGKIPWPRTILMKVQNCPQTKCRGDDDVSAQQNKRNILRCKIQLHLMANMLCYTWTFRSIEPKNRFKFPFAACIFSLVELFFKQKTEEEINWTQKYWDFLFLLTVCLTIFLHNVT